jgi:hypothetical protein
MSLSKKGHNISPIHISRIVGTQKGSVHYYDGADNGKQLILHGQLAGQLLHIKN